MRIHLWLSALALPLLVLVAVSCSDQPSSDNEYALKVEDLSDQSHQRIEKQLTLKWRGERTIKVGEGGRFNKSYEVSSAVVRIYANIADNDGVSSKTLNYALDIKRNSESNNSYGRSQPVEDDAQVGDFITLTIKNGKYPIGEDLAVGTFDGKPIILRVE